MKSQEIAWLLKDKYNGQKSPAFLADCKRLALGEPLAYLIGWTPFLNCKIWLDSKPLIPRPETEHWIEEAIKVMQKGVGSALQFAADSTQILDLCAGSGCIGTAVAKHVPSTNIDFIEIEANHLPTINKNLQENNIKPNRYSVTHADLFVHNNKKYNFILTNPPYIDESLHRTDLSVIKHEPYVALFGGHAGMEVIAKIITQSPDHLSPDGQLWIEHEPEQSAIISHLGNNAGFITTTHKDQFKVERYSILMLQ